MRSFFNYAKNRFLYNFFRLIIFIIIGFILADVVKAETVSYELSESSITNLTTFESSSKLTESNVLISYWEEKYSSTYPYYYVYWSAPYVNLHMFKEVPTMSLSSNNYYLTLPSKNQYLYYYNYSVQVVTANNSISREVFNTSSLTFNYDNYVISNFDLESTIDFSFVYGDKTYTYAVGDTIPTMMTFYNNLNSTDTPEDSETPVDPENPGTTEDSTENTLDSQTIYNYLALIALCLITPIVLKFLNNMFSLKGSDL